MDHTDTSPTVTDNTTVMNNTAVTDTSSTVTDNTTVVTITDEKKKVPQQQKSITQVINKRIYYYDNTNTKPYLILPVLWIKHSHNYTITTITLSSFYLYVIHNLFFF